MKAIFIIARATVQELFYERFFHLLLFFTFISFGMSAILGNLTYSEQAKLTLDFMLGTTHLSLILFSLVIGIRLFHGEFVIGSIYMTLSKPVSRASFLLGKFCGQAIVQLLVITTMITVTLLIRSQFDVPMYYTPVLQTGFLIFLESLIVSAVTYLFAIHAGAILTSVSVLAFFGISHFRGPVTRELAGSSVSAWALLKPLIPDLEVFNLKNLASYGIGLNGEEFFYAGLYGACTILFFITAALMTFQQKDIGS